MKKRKQIITHTHKKLKNYRALCVKYFIVHKQTCKKMQILCKKNNKPKQNTHVCIIEFGMGRKIIQINYAKYMNDVTLLKQLE